jgi:hypothetical protein
VALIGRAACALITRTPCSSHPHSTASGCWSNLLFATQSDAFHGTVDRACSYETRQGSHFCCVDPQSWCSSPAPHRTAHCWHVHPCHEVIVTYELCCLHCKPTATLACLGGASIGSLILTSHKGYSIAQHTQRSAAQHPAKSTYHGSRYQEGVIG